MSDTECGRLDGRVAVITGAAGVIGRAAAALLARRGARIVAVDRPSAAMHALEDALPPGHKAIQIAADVTRKADVDAYAAAAVAQAGRIDIFFNNAGIEGPQAPIAEYPVGDFRYVLEVNVVGVFLGLQAVLPIMMAQKSGSVINTSSIAGMVGAPNMAGYIASKHAVLGLTRVAALEAASSGVRVNSIHPGFIDSRMLSDIGSRLGVTNEMLAAAVPMGRLGTPEEVAKAAAFLASDESSYMNGAALVVDGAKTVG